MDFSNDPNVYNIPDQFMFGKEMMICPVTKPGALSRSVYLPKATGNWVDFWTGKKYQPGTNIQANAPLETIPIFVKAGSIIPMGPFMQYANEKKADTLELRVYTGTNGKFELYEDEGDNFNYKQGKYSLIGFSWDEQKHILTISDRKGEYNGMLTKRVINVVFVSEQHGTGLNIEVKPDYVVNYQGLKIEVKAEK
jgi:alpha-D-xyloside xylohydrolase